MMFTIRVMKIYPSARRLGFFDGDLRLPWAAAKGNPLSRLDAVTGWEGFHPLLEETMSKPAKGRVVVRPTTRSRCSNCWSGNGMTMYRINRRSIRWRPS